MKFARWNLPLSTLRYIFVLILQSWDHSVMLGRGRTTITKSALLPDKEKVWTPETQVLVFNYSIMSKTKNPSGKFLIYVNHIKQHEISWTGRTEYEFSILAVRPVCVEWILGGRKGWTPGGPWHGHTLVNKLVASSQLSWLWICEFCGITASC